MLPAGTFVLERGWLSSNNILFIGADEAALVDSGYATHSAQTLDLVRRRLEGRALATLVNTHLHSDHCGGNARLKESFPALRIAIPPGQAAHVRSWDEKALTYEPTGQVCPRFDYDELLRPGGEIRLGDTSWQVHAAPGHDPHSVILFEPGTRTLISADALWENGFGVVFPELEGEKAFDEVAATLDLIERLAPKAVIPGHGRVFSDVEGALARARSRLTAFVAAPERHAAHAAKVLVKFKLLEWQRVRLEELAAWASRTAYFRDVHAKWFAGTSLEPWVVSLVADLERSGVARIDSGYVVNS